MDCGLPRRTAALGAPACWRARGREQASGQKAGASSRTPRTRHFDATLSPASPHFAEKRRSGTMQFLPRVKSAPTFCPRLRDHCKVNSVSAGKLMEGASP